MVKYGTLCCFAILWMAEITCGLDDDPLVELTGGRIRGARRENYHCFLGIPFAQPPVGPLRFQPPSPMSKWEGVLETREYRAQCPQLGLSPGDADEDCLYLNVFAPKERGKELLPVMVYIHGGAFITGGATWYDCERAGKNFADNGVILVTIQYRLNLFGFFTTETHEFPANLGMKDQVEALKWVTREIESFGGDPKRVTLFGESAGSKSVSLHTYSPASRGLFHGVVMESGTAYCPGTLFGNQNQRPPSSKLTAVATGCITPDKWDRAQFQGLGDCIRAIPWSRLLKLSSDVVTQDLNDRSSFINWAPRVSKGDSFLPAYPNDLHRQPQLPVMIGINRDENYYWSLFSLISGKISMEDFGAYRFEQVLDAYSSPKIWEKYSEEVRSVLKHAYTPKPKPESDDRVAWLRAIVKLESHRSYISGTLMEAKSLATMSDNVYLYSFEYLSDGFPWPMHNGQPIEGAFHAMDEALLFNEPNLPNPVNWKFSSRDDAMVRQMGKIWTNFAKTGNPNTPEPLSSSWKPLRSDGENLHYHLDTQSETEKHFHREADQIWNEMIPRVTGGEKLTMPRKINREEL